jgi:hypothetical protein
MFRENFVEDFTPNTYLKTIFLQRILFPLLFSTLGKLISLQEILSQKAAHRNADNVKLLELLQSSQVFSQSKYYLAKNNPKNSF